MKPLKNAALEVHESELYFPTVERLPFIGCICVGAVPAQYGKMSIWVARPLKMYGLRVQLVRVSVGDIHAHIDVVRDRGSMQERVTTPIAGSHPHPQENSPEGI